MADNIKPKGNPPILDTKKLTGGTSDPRGDNRPGVLPDPPQDGIDPVTNLSTELVDAETGAPKTTTEIGQNTINPHPADAGPAPRERAAPKGRKIKMVMERDYWPRTRPPGHPEDAEFRVRSGETVELPEEEAMDVMESGTGRRADRRA